MCIRETEISLRFIVNIHVSVEERYVLEQQLQYWSCASTQMFVNKVKFHKMPTNQIWVSAVSFEFCISWRSGLCVTKWRAFLHLELSGCSSAKTFRRSEELGQTRKWRNPWRGFKKSDWQLSPHDQSPTSFVCTSMSHMHTERRSLDYTVSATILIFWHHSRTLPFS